MPPSPQVDAEGPVRVTVKGGGCVSVDAKLLSVTVRRAINRVPSATLVFADGDRPSQRFPLSDAADFMPGVEIELMAGYGDHESTIFKGIVVRHGLSIDGAHDARLIVECRDKAVKMTVGRKNAVFRDQSDADIMSRLIGNAGLTADVALTTTVQSELVQHYCSDWDFVLARAEANGRLVRVEDGTVHIHAPGNSDNASLAVAYGESLISFQAEVDAQGQYASVEARAWDMKTQDLLRGASAGPATLPAQGNLDSATLAKVIGLPSYGLQSGAALSVDALDAWAQAQQLKSGLSRLRGTMSFQGSALAAVGKPIELKGVGDRFSGTVLVTGLTHTIEAGRWTTQAEFGSPASWSTERSDIMAPPAAGLLPGIRGLHVGRVVKLDGDPEQAHRIQVSVPTADVDHVWARLMQFHASNGFGAFFVPEIGDEVVLGWFDDDPTHPVVLGGLYSAKNVPPQQLAAENHIKTLVTRGQLSLTFDDENKVVTVRTPAGNVVVLSDQDKAITLTDQNGNTVELGDGGITLESPRDIRVSAQGSISVDAQGALTLSSQADAKIEGLNVNATAKVDLVAKGSASAELSAAGQTTVKGAMVMIN